MQKACFGSDWGVGSPSCRRAGRRRLRVTGVARLPRITPILPLSAFDRSIWTVRPGRGARCRRRARGGVEPGHGDPVGTCQQPVGVGNRRSDPSRRLTQPGGRRARGWRSRYLQESIAFVYADGGERFLDESAEIAASRRHERGPVGRGRGGQVRRTRRELGRLAVRAVLRLRQRPHLWRSKPPWPVCLWSSVINRPTAHRSRPTTQRRQ